jgi:hypothetical protein
MERDRTRREDAMNRAIDVAEVSDDDKPAHGMVIRPRRIESFKDQTSG